MTIYKSNVSQNDPLKYFPAKILLNVIRLDSCSDTMWLVYTISYCTL